jgi:hypothetical protein
MLGQHREMRRRAGVRSQLLVRAAAAEHERKHDHNRDDSNGRAAGGKRASGEAATLAGPARHRPGVLDERVAAAGT